MPTVTELDTTIFVQLKYDFTHNSFRKAKEQQVYLALIIHCLSSANSQLVVVMMLGFGWGIFVWFFLVLTLKTKSPYF